MPGPGVNEPEEIIARHLQGLGETAQGEGARLHLAALDLAEIGRGNARALGEGLLLFLLT